MSKIYSTLKIVLFLLLIQGCSSNGFKLRKNVELRSDFSHIYLQGLDAKTDFTSIFLDALKEAGGGIVASESQAKSLLKFIKFEEGRRVTAYTSDRRAREYLVFLKIDYSLSQVNNKSDKKVIFPKKRINIDRTYLYDPDFALGKSEEEKRVKQALYEEATRLILLRLKYSSKT